MRIAVLGAGNAGGALSKAGVAAGHQVVVSAAHPKHAQQVASTAGGLAASSNAEAVDRADVVILAVPHTAVAGIADELSDALTGKVVVDSTNPVNDTYSDLVTTGVSAAEELQRRLPGAHVVKAFNSILAGRHGNPVERDLPLDAFIAGDHAEAKDRVGGARGDGLPQHQPEREPRLGVADRLEAGRPDRGAGRFPDDDLGRTGTAASRPPRGAGEAR